MANRVKRRALDKLIYVLITGAILCCLVSCAKPEPKTPVVYPSGWPIPELTAPPGASANYISTIHLDPNDPLHHGTFIDGLQVGRTRKYVIGFKCDQSWDQVVQHVEECLSNYSYDVSEELDEADNSSKWFELWDRPLEINLYRADKRQEGRCWHIMIEVYE